MARQAMRDGRTTGSATATDARPGSTSARVPDGRARLADARPDRTRALGPQIYALLRRAIVRGELGPDEPIDERRVAVELGVSRTPVREAVRRLTDERFVNVVAQSSTRVAALDPVLLEESRLIRRTLEIESAAQAAPHMTERHALAMEETLLVQRTCLDDGRFGDAIEADDEFHHAIASVSGRERLWRTIELEKAHVDRCRHRMLPLPGQAEVTIVHHRRILEALRSGDAARARVAMATHLDTAWESTRHALGAGPVPGADPDDEHPIDADEETSQRP